jgi:hypothetical protein
LIVRIQKKVFLVEDLKEEILIDVVYNSKIKLEDGVTLYG